MPAAVPLRPGSRFESADSPLEFAHPPLIEAWLGVEFESPLGLAGLDANEVRRRLGPEWPAVWQSIGSAERHAPATTQIEQQLRNVMNDRAIRFRENGFSFGWLGHDGSIYPRYETIRDGFVATLDALSEMVTHIGTPTKACVTYLNRIPRGTVWSTPGDWSFFKLWQPNPLTKLKVGPESFAGMWTFPLVAERGHLTIELTHEPVNPLNEIESLWLRITSSGPVDSEETALFDGLDFGREMIVRAFGELTSPDAKEYWGVAPRK